MVFRMLGPVAILVAALAAGCGGGGGDAATPTPQPPAATTVVLSGIAATGAPFADATVTVYDRNGTEVKSDTTGDDGSFTLEIPSTTPAPLVLQATRGDTTMVSLFAETKSTRLNVTPVTNLIAARLSPDGDPLSLRTGAEQVTPERLAAAVDEVTALLQPLRAAVGETVNPLTGEFSADGTGHDRLLDSLSITIRPAGGYSNIEVAVRSDDATLVTNFASNDPAPVPLPPVAAEDLAPVGIAQLVSDLANRMTACYAVPLEQRVSGATSSSVNVTGDASAVIAPACRTLFLNDDPASYLNNGIRVGRDSNNNGAFTGFFRRGATDAVFSDARLEFLRGNDDIVFSYTVRGTDGSISTDTLVARNSGSALKLVGNQYAYNARVRAWISDREFLNQPAADYRSTGYNIWIANQVQGNAPLFDKVLVTAPDGKTYTYRPQAGRSELTAIKADGTQSNSSVQVLAAAFKNSSTSGSPATYETGSSFASPAYTEDQLTAIPEQGVWTLEFFHADATRANVVQRYRTLSRAPTLSEAALVPIADLTATAKAELRAETAATGVVRFGAPSASNPNVADLSTAGGNDFWTVPAGAAAPITVSVYGRGPDPDGSGPLRGPNFDDRVSVAQTARKAFITCTTLSAGDTHCDNSTGVNQYAQGSTISVLELFAVGPRAVEVSKLPAFYYLLPR